MAKKHKHEEHENHERWLVSYADFITLLFAFFVVMYATSTQDDAKAEKFEKSIRNNFHMGTYGGGQNPINIEAGNIIAPLGQHITDGSPIGMQNYYLKKVDSRLSLEEKGSVIQEITHDESGVRIRLQGSNLFQPGETRLNPASLVALGELAIILKNAKRRMVVEGHTDNQKVSGNVATNWELGALRATTVVRYFIDDFGIPGNRMSATTFGDTQPVGKNDTIEGRSANRRIEIFIPAGKAGRL